MPTLTQRRAADAHNKVHEIATNNQFEGIRKQYGSLARGVPSMIQINGLGPTLAFLLAKAKGEEAKPHKQLYNHFSAWLSANVMPGFRHDPADILNWIITQSAATYHMATAEALEYATWIKRFAEAEGLVSDDAGDDD